MSQNPYLSRIQNQPALIEEGHGKWLEACLAVVHSRADELEKADHSSTDFWESGMEWARPYIVENGVLQIPVKGVLLNDFPYALGSWATGYEYIWQAVRRGVDDSEVKGIALVINSGGGMVSGNWDLVDRIASQRGTKPIRAFAAEHAYSAAYNIAAATDHITVARTGGVGSIGVIITHFEYSKALESSGITVNLIRSKPGKMEGNSYEGLSDGARKRMQERVDESHNQFVATVAKNRGMTVEAVDQTDALTFTSQAAIENGLADEIGAFDDAITAFVASVNQGDGPMAVDPKAGITEEALASAVEAATAAGVTAGMEAATARISAIIGSEEAETRPAAAHMLAFDTTTSAEKAIISLGKLPAEAAAVPAVADPAPAGAGVGAAVFTAAMGNTPNPNIAAEDTASGEPTAEDRQAHRRNLRTSFGLAGFNATTKE